MQPFSALTLVDFSPFASFVAMRTTKQHPDAELLLLEILGAIEPSAGWVHCDEIPAIGGPSFQPEFVVVLVEDRPANWLSTGSLVDRLNHLLVGFIDGEFALIYASDSKIKLQIQDALIKGSLAEWQCVEHAVLNTAFLHGEKLRALWLGAAHRSVDFRPDSKVMSGSNLREAVDPFGDASFIPSAARSQLAGVSLNRSGVWKGSKTSWIKFCVHAETLVRAMQRVVQTGSLESAVHPSLAHWCRDFTGASGAYDVCFADEETLEPGIALMERLKGLQEFELKIIDPLPTSPLLPESVRVKVQHFPSNQEHDVDIVPFMEQGCVRFIVEVDAAAPIPFQQFKEAIESSAELVRVYYDSGHVITGGTLSEATVQDNSFDNFVNGDFSMPKPHLRYLVGSEKPAGNNISAWLPKMSSPQDRSLFSWVRRCGLPQLALESLAPGRAWLYCDDGSGEIADFLHVFKPLTGVPKITAIHVKGAHNKSSSRQISIGAYEVVVSQAIKNLRQILAGNIRQKIDAAINFGGPARVWNTDWPALPSANAQAELQGALNDITTQCDYEVIIVQPHVVRSYYDTVATQTPSMKLRTLLFGALTMARSANAQFRVVIDGT